MTTPVDIDKLKADYAELGINEEQWFALIHAGGYDLCVENARWRPDHPNMDDIIGRFACGDLAIKCLPVIAQALNALPALIAKAERVADAEELLRQAMNVLGTVDANYALDPIADDGTTVWDGMQAESKRLWKLYRKHLAARSPKESE